MRKLIIAASSLMTIAALSLSAYAQTTATPSPTPEMKDGKMDMKDGQMMMVMPNGQMHAMKPDADATKTMSKEGKSMPGNMMMQMQGGKMMMMQDMKMPDGKMMSDHMTMMMK
jgi:hypothetical protein